jgi:hypothetical protein
MIADPERILKPGRPILKVAIGGLAAQPAVASARTVPEPKCLAARRRHRQALPLEEIFRRRRWCRQSWPAEASRQNA